MRPDLPTGTVTFLFTDVEGSTRLLDDLGVEAFSALLAEHHRVCREAWAAHGGVEIDTAGDAFFVAFSQPSDALAAAAAAQEALASLGVPVRMGMHTGEAALGETGYVGMDVHRAARIAAAGHGGQVLVSSSTAALVPATLTDLGEHRFKDLRAAERVFQLGSGTFPRLRSLYRSNLPVPATPFLGRENELAAVRAMLAEPGARLVSLTGPGGTGKTRLALQVVAEASDGFPDGVFWAPLAPLRDPRLVLAEVAAAAGVREREGGGSALDDLGSGLAGKRTLLLLDNAEHLLPAVAEEVGRLVAACPTITAVVTSRERLQLPGERVFPVPPMSVTEGEELFRRRAADAGVELNGSGEVRTLCARLDNIPLALELAAARMVMFSPAQLLGRLSHSLDLLKGGRGVDARQGTLRATIAWSHDLLGAEERCLFRRLSVFAGGCTYESAEQVAGADPDTLQSLLDKSLLRRRDSTTGPRFWMLETIREYAGEQLAAAGETDEVEQRHLEHYAAVAAACYDESWSGLADLARLVEERDNLRLALDRALDAAPETALVLGSHLVAYWVNHGESREGREKLAAALERASARPTARRALAVMVLGILASAQRDWAAADPLCLEALELSRMLRDPLGEGRALLWLGWSAYCRRELDLARRYSEEGVQVLGGAPGGEYWRRRGLSNISLVLSALGDHASALAIQREVVAETRKVSSDFPLAMALNHLGELERAAGDTAESRRLLEESVRLMRRMGLTPFLGATLHSLGCALRESAPDDALAAFSEGLEIGREIDAPDVVASCLEGAARMFASGRDPDHAASLLGAAAAIRARVGADPQEQADAEAARAECANALAADAFATAWELGAALEADEAAEWALGVWRTRRE